MIPGAPRRASSPDGEIGEGLGLQWRVPEMPRNPGGRPTTNALARTGPVRLTPTPRHRRARPGDLSVPEDCRVAPGHDRIGGPRVVRGGHAPPAARTIADQCSALGEYRGGRGRGHAVGATLRRRHEALVRTGQHRIDGRPFRSREARRRVESARQSRQLLRLSRQGRYLRIVQIWTPRHQGAGPGLPPRIYSDPSPSAAPAASRPPAHRPRSRTTVLPSRCRSASARSRPAPAGDRSARSTTRCP